MIDKKKLLKLNQLPSELSAYFILHIALCLAGYIAILIFGILTKMVKESLFIAIPLTFYFVSKLLLLHHTLSGKILMYEGICEKHHGKEYALKNPVNKKKLMSTYSYSYITAIVMVNGEKKKFEVPCGYNFSAKEGDLIRVYTQNAGIYTKNDNTFVISNPFFIKVAET